MPFFKVSHDFGVLGLGVRGRSGLLLRFRGRHSRHKVSTTVLQCYSATVLQCTVNNSKRSIKQMSP